MKKVIVFGIVILIVAILFFVFIKIEKFGVISNALDPIQENLVVEEYIRKNIKTILSEKPVLGGSWYVTFIELNPSTKTGIMVYEDGHIQGNKNFSYSVDGDQIVIDLKKSTACTMDAKQCPDGSYVGRSGPDCEFICPQY